MKLHRNLVEAVANAVSEILEQQAHATQVVENLLASNKKWGARDRSFIAENIYEIVRNRLLLEHLAQSKNPYFLLAANLKLQKIELPEWEVFSGFSFRNQEGKVERKITFSIPDWLDEFGKQQLGEAAWNKEMEAMHTTAKTCLRVNTLKTTLQNATKQLQEENVAFEVVENAIVLNGRKNIQNTIAYRSGWVEIQDVNSQKIVPLLNAKSKEIIVDACAGAGGKTLHLAAEMKNEGHIFALDVFEAKLQELKRRAQRAGARNITTLLANNASFQQLKGKADKLLLDVPCSGSGVFRRKPDSKFKLNLSQLSELQALQWQILSTYHHMLKPGGNLLYATCSIFPSENEKQLQRFLNEFGAQYVLEREYHFSPSQTGFDGFYGALIRKN